MQHDPPIPTRLRSPFTATIAVALTFLIAFAAAPRPAAADPVVWTDPGGSGAQVTLEPGEVDPGGRILISGTGFHRKGGNGLPWIAIKPDEQDLFWAYGGPDEIPGEPADAPIWFQAKTDGTFSGWIDLPADVPPIGPGSGANAGAHWLRILSGAFSSTGEESTTRPISYQAFFTVLDRVQIGALGPTGVYKRGSHFSPDGVVTLRSTDLPASTPVTVKLDGATIGTATTDATGALPTSPAATSVTIPADTAPGVHELSFAVGGETITRPITVHAAPNAVVRNLHVRPGGLVDVTVTGFVGVAGTGQKVAVLIGAGQAAPTVACIQADASGAGHATVRVPDGLTGSQLIRFPAGSKCQTPADPGFAADDVPARAATLGTPLYQALTVDESAPAIAVTTDGVRGATVRVTGSGFTPDATLGAEIDGAAAGAPVTVGDDGRFSADVPVDAAVTPGEHLLFVGDGTTGAAVRFTVVDPAPAPFDGGGDTTPTTPATQTSPTAQTTPARPDTPRPATTPTPAAPKLKAYAVRRGRMLRLTLAGTKGRKVAVTVKSRKRLRVSATGRAKIITFVKATTKRTGVVSFALTKDGRKALKRLKKASVVVTLKPSGGSAVKKTVTLRP